MSPTPTTTPPGDKNGGGTAGAAAASCPCPKDFTLDAPCKIVKVGGKMLIAAWEIPGTPAGSYVWKASSDHVKLINAHSPHVTVQGVKAGAGRDSETLTVTRSAKGCPPITKTVQVTVAKVTFSAAPDQRWGYDDYDTPGNSDDDHISIKSSDYTTVKVTITGGAVGTDFDFVCDSSDICKPEAAPGSPSFDLKLNGGSTNKGSTILKAKVKCPSAEVFATLGVHVYKELLVEVVVGKFFDSKSPGTKLKFPDIDFAAFAAQINAKAKEAVVKYVITNLDPAGKPTDVNYDKDANGSLSFDIGGNGGTEFDAINTAFKGAGTKIRVAIVRDMKSYYYLKGDVAAGATTLETTAGSAFKPDRPQPLGSGANQEMVTVTGAAGGTYTIHPGTTKAHKAGEGIEFPAAGWSSDPILIIEGNSSEDTVKWTVFHETGHRALKLADAEESDTIMHYIQQWADHRLRYCPRVKHYTPAEKENQWETIPRT